MNKPDDWTKACSIAICLLFAGWLLWTWTQGDSAVAAEYRQQHCILVFGHWLAVDRPANAYCQ